MPATQNVNKHAFNAFTFNYPVRAKTRRAHVSKNSLGLKIVTSTAIMFLYVIGFFVIFPYFQGVSAAFALFPICYSGWKFGKKGGLTAGIGYISLNFFLLVYFFDFPLMYIATVGFGPNLILILVGVLVGHAKDINIKAQTEIETRILAQEMLKSSEEKMRKMLHNLPLGVVLIDAETHIIVEANSIACKMIGLECEKIIGNICHNFICPEDYGKCPITDFGMKIDQRETVLKRPGKEDLPIIKSVVPIMLDGRKYLLDCFANISTQKKNEIQLSEEIEWTKTILDIAGVLILVLDDQGIVELINQKGLEILGLYNIENVVGKNWFDNFVPESRIADSKTIFKEITSIGTEIFENIEDTILTSTGEERVIAWHHSVIRNEEGDITHTISSGVDITEKKNAESSLKKNEQKYRKLFDKANDGVVLSNFEGKIIDVNKKICDMLGYSKRELLKIPLYKIYSEDVRDGVKQTIMNNTQGRRYITNLIRSDKTEIQVEVSTSLIDKEKGIIQGIVRDFRERNAMEQELKRSAKFTRSILDNISDQILILDINDLTIVGANQVFLDAYGLKEKEVIGKYCYKLTHNLDSPCEESNNNCPLHEMIRTGENQSAEHIHIMKDGKNAFVEVRVSPIRDEKGNIIQAIHLVRDISERKKMEKELRKAHDKLKMKIKKLEEFKEITVDRELVIIKLKKKIKMLEKRLKNR